jgi:hypothetical protein
MFFQLLERSWRSPPVHFAFFLEAAKGGTNHLAGSLVKTATYFFFHEFFQFGGQDTFMFGSSVTDAS